MSGGGKTNELLCNKSMQCFPPLYNHPTVGLRYSKCKQSGVYRVCDIFHITGLCLSSRTCCTETHLFYLYHALLFHLLTFLISTFLDCDNDLIETLCHGTPSVSQLSSFCHFLYEVSKNIVLTKSTC